MTSGAVPPSVKVVRENEKWRSRKICFQEKTDPTCVENITVHTLAINASNTQDAAGQTGCMAVSLEGYLNTHIAYLLNFREIKSVCRLTKKWESKNCFVHILLKIKRKVHGQLDATAHVVRSNACVGTRRPQHDHAETIAIISSWYAQTRTNNRITTPSFPPLQHAQKKIF